MATIQPLPFVGGGFLPLSKPNPIQERRRTMNGKKVEYPAKLVGYRIDAVHDCEVLPRRG